MTSGSCIHVSSYWLSLLMSSPPLRCVRHEPVFVFVVTFGACDCFLRGNIAAALFPAQPLSLNHCVEARERLMDGYTRVDELPQPVPDFRVVDAGGVFDDLLECFFDGHVSGRLWVLGRPRSPGGGERGLYVVQSQWGRSVRPHVSHSSFRQVARCSACRAVGSDEIPRIRSAS